MPKKIEKNRKKSYKLSNKKPNKESAKMNKIIAIAFLIFITAITFYNSLGNQFTNWDDDVLIVNNQAIRNLNFSHIKEIFDITRGGTYQPVRVLSYAIDYHFQGLNPLLYHIHNILLHCLASVFLFLALLNALPRLLKRNLLKVNNQENFGEEISFEKNAVFGIAFLTALLFAVHPVNVEAVTWLSDRKYVLLAFFSFAGFYFFTLESSEKWKNIISVVSALVCSVLAAFSSPFGVVLPALFFLYEYCASDEINPVKIIMKRPGIFLPFIIIGSMVFILLWMKLAGKGGAATFYFRGDIIYTLYTLMQALFDYIRNIFFPFWLNNRYMDYVYLSPFDYYKIPAGFIGFTAVISFSIYKFKKGDKFWLFCIGWFLTALAPASNIIPISIKMADRYIYLAVPGIFLLISYYAFCLKLKFSDIDFWKYAWYMGIIVIVTGCCFISAQRNLVWKNSVTLWSDSVKKDPRNPIAWNDLGAGLFSKGKLKKAEFCYRQAIKMNRKGKKQLENLSFLLFNQGRFKEAVKFYKKLLELDPDNFMANAALGEIYLLLDKPALALKYADKIMSMHPDNPEAVAQKGNLLFAMGSTETALALYNKALALFPESPELFYNKAVALEKLNHKKDALLSLSRALKLKPGAAEFWNLAGKLYFEEKKFAKAEEYLKKAISLHAGLYEAYNNLGNFYEKQKLFKKALKNYEKALKIRPDFTQAVYNRCLVLYNLGSSDGAAVCYRNLLKKNPGHAESLNNLGHIYAEKGQYKTAIKFFRKAVKNKNDFSDAHYNLAKLLSLEGSSDAAIVHYKDVLKINPGDVDALNNLAFIYNAKGDIDKEENIFYRMVRLFPDKSSVHFNLGLVLAKKGKTKKAVDQFIKALKLDPENKAARKILEQSHIIKKDRF